eukprot:symbB.v1.2.034159.t1/scaffold4292.1/size81749/2
MYVVVSGTLEYTDSYGEVTSVGEKRYLAEAVLWTNWKHRGTLTAVSDVKLAMLDAQGFFDLCQRFMRRSEAALKILGYATQFIDELNKSTKEVQMLTGTKIGIREIPDDPENRSLNIAGPLANTCAAYMLMMKRYLDSEAASLNAKPVV